MRNVINFNVIITDKSGKILYKGCCISPLGVYGCETWSRTLWEERRLSVFENSVLRRIFSPKKDEVTGEWRKLYNEELKDLYSSPNIARVLKWRRMRWVGHVAHIQGFGGET